MNWVVVITLIVSVSLNVLFAVLISTRSSQSMLLLDRAHSRTTEYTEGLVDRLMAQDFGTFKAYEMMPVGEQLIEEEEEQVVPIRGPDRGGFGSRLGLAGYRSPEEDMAALESEVP